MISAVRYVPFHDARKWVREGLRTRDAHVCRQLSKTFPVEAIAVLDRPTCTAEAVRLRGQWRTPGRVIRDLGRAVLTEGPTGAPVADHLSRDIGFRHGRFHHWLMEAYGSKRYERALRALFAVDGGTAEVLWLCHPFAARMVNWLPNARVCLDAFDNFAIHPEFSPSVHRAVFEHYRLLCHRAERIVVNSSAMQEYLHRHFARDALLVPNGVDPDLFTNAAPLALQELERPIIGYAGKLGQRIDVELLVALARALPQGTVVLAGQVLNQRWMRGAARQARIRHVGDLHYRELPRFLAACDVCIVPHRVGNGENHGDATKIYEYLAARRPTISTAIEGAWRFDGRITIARTTADFVAATIAAAWRESVPNGAVLPSETWAARTRTIADYFGVAAASRRGMPQ